MLTNRAFSFPLLVLTLMGSALLTSGVALQQPQKPDESRFTPAVLVPPGELDEPNTLAVARDGRVFISERRAGAIKLFDPTTNTVSIIGTIPVNTTYISASGQQRRAEEGLLGITLDPNFDQNPWLYAVFATANASTHQLSRFDVRDGMLVMSSERVVLAWDTQRETCCHTGGGMAWDRSGNLYITTGNNTGNVMSSQTDQRPGRMNWDDQRGASNTNDLRGKILRIHPEPNGTYTIPSGNLFAPGTPNTRPEIYTMGHRNPWRPSIDSQTGYLYWGEIGPDAPVPAENTVEGYDEFNQARRPGFFGWPYFIGPNRAYPITDYTTCTGAGNQQTCGVLPPKDPARPINDSRWNNGLRALPPAQPAFIPYPYAPSAQFPDMGSGARCAVGGPVYRRSDLPPNAARPWPAYYEGTWFVTDCSRNWVLAISMTANGDYQSMERFLPSYWPVEPLDMKFGPDGDLYVLEYGSTWFAKGTDTKLVRIEYNAGNRPPVAEISSDVTGGVLPFSARLSAEGTRDPDNDPLRYEWRVAPTVGGSARTFSTAAPTVPFTQPGEYHATLTVRDPSGASAVSTLRILAGNEPPTVDIMLGTGNQTFYFPGEPINYTVRVVDREDGTVAPGTVAVSADYVPEGFDLKKITQGDRPVDTTTRFAVAQALMAGSACRTCHSVTPPRSAGPSFSEIAARYRSDGSALARLAEKVRGGGTGVWGDVAMPAHPAMSSAEATAIVRYILNSDRAEINPDGLTGSYTPDIPVSDNGRGSVVVRGVYTDRGAGAAAGQTAEQLMVLRSPRIASGTADIIENATVTTGNRGAGPLGIVPRQNGHIGFRSLDLTGIRQIDLFAFAIATEGHQGGTIEARFDSPTGPLAGQTQVLLGQLGGRGAAIAPGGGPGSAAPPVRIEMTPVNGSRDLYFVFRNPSAPAGTALMHLSTIRVGR